MELVKRRLARSRDEAARLIAEGRVEVRGMTATKSASVVDPATPIRLNDTDGPHFVSRGAYKLAGALIDFGGPDVLAGSPEARGPASEGARSARAGSDTPVGSDTSAGTDSNAASAASRSADQHPAGGVRVVGRRCLDAGASTGGFTDVLLRAGARQVIAVDVGYGQLAWPIRTDDRVTVHDRTNIRTLSTDTIGDPVDLAVADLSFISLPVVLPALTSCVTPGGDVIPMVKPQFEVGRGRLGKGGVVREPELRAEAVTTVCAAAARLGWGTVDVARSRLPGPAGNVEFFVWLRRDADGSGVAAAIERAVSG